MAKVYVSSHDLWAAKYMAQRLTQAGHTVVSTWHEREDKMTKEGAGGLIAVYNDPEIRSADALVLIACQGMVPGGKHVEAGIALGAGKRVYVLGDRENKLYYHPKADAVANVKMLLASLNGLTPG